MLLALKILLEKYKECWRGQWSLCLLCNWCSINICLVSAERRQRTRHTYRTGLKCSPCRIPVKWPWGHSLTSLVFIPPSLRWKKCFLLPALWGIKWEAIYKPSTQNLACKSHSVHGGCCSSVFGYGGSDHGHYFCYFVVVQSLSHVPTLCDPMDCRKLGFRVHHQLPELAQTHVQWVSDALQPCHPVSGDFSSCLQSFPASGSFPVSQCFASGG